MKLINLAEQSSPNTVRREAWERGIQDAANVADGFNVTPAFDLPCSPFDRTEAIAEAIRALATKQGEPT